MLAAQFGDGVAGPALLIVAVTGSAFVLMGYVKAVFDRARFDYKKTKAGLPGMRKDVWSSAWRMVKTGFVIAVIAICLVVWAVNDARESDATPHPGPSIDGR